VERGRLRVRGLEGQGTGVDLAASLRPYYHRRFALVTALEMYRGYRAGRLGSDAFPRYAAALILAFMLGSKSSLRST
jgi:hypothetical protein